VNIDFWEGFFLGVMAYPVIGLLIGAIVIGIFEYLDRVVEPRMLKRSRIRQSDGDNTEVKS